MAIAVAELREDLGSHFVYEETEMTAPLGLLGLGVRRPFCPEQKRWKRTTWPR